MNIEDLLRNAIAAEAKATRRRTKDVAKVWALVYADAAVALFERLRIESGKARALVNVAHAYHARKAELSEFDRAWRVFKNSPSGRYQAAILAKRAVLQATEAVRDAWPVERLAEAAVALGNAEGYARNCPLLGVRAFIESHREQQP